MRKTLKLATGLAVATTMTTALAATSGSGAFAEDLVPTLTAAQDAVAEVATATGQGAQDASVETEVSFVSEPVVQDLPPEPEEAPEAELPVLSQPANSLRELIAIQPQPRELSRQMHCLAGAIYFEARGEPIEGQLAVGRVIIERANSSRFPNSYCGVVTQRSQFSFVRGGRIPAPRKGTKAWKRAVALAQIADQGTWESPAEGALFFHATYVSPKWRLKRIAQIDNHIFYR